MRGVCNWYRNRGKCPKCERLRKIVDIFKLMKKQIKDIVYNYLWKGKRDRVKRSVVCNPMENGGLKMLDIDQYISALKAAWVPKIVTMKGKWADYFHHINKELCMPHNYIWQTTARKI